MKIVIIGAGNVGENIVKNLVKEGHEIVIIDKDSDIINAVVNEYNVKGLVGNGVLAELQKEADTNHADIVISVSDSDELNIISSLVAKSLGAQTIIARLRKIEYSKQYEFMRDNLGIDLLINPEKEAARKIAQLLRFPYALNVVPFAGGRINGLTIEIPADCNLIGLKIGEIDDILGVNVVIYAAEKNGNFIIPDEDYIIEESDKLSIIAKPDVMRTFSKKIGFVNNRIKNIMILGGSSVSFYLAQMLVENKMQVKVIENNKNICEELSETLGNNISIVMADGSDYNILQEEGVDDIDAFVSLTDNDEENIVLSLYAKSRGVANIFTKIEDEKLMNIAKKVELIKCISTKSETAIEIVKFARNLSSEKLENNPLLSLSKILTEKGEAIEFEVDENEKICNIPLKQLKLIKDAVIACILRGQDIIIPHGSDTLLVGDKIIVVTKASHLESLEDILR